MASSASIPKINKQALTIAGKRSLEKRPKTYNLTTNEQRRKLLDAVSTKGISVLRVRI